MSDMHSTGHRQDHVYKPDVYFPNILSPYFRSPLTDVFASMINHQQYGKCAKFEMNMMECMEAYGLDKGRVKCADLIDDFNECHNMTKQFLRHMAMEAERERQFKAGEVKEQYAPPPRPFAY